MTSLLLRLFARADRAVTRRLDHLTAAPSISPDEVLRDNELLAFTTLPRRESHLCCPCCAADSYTDCPVRGRHTIPCYVCETA